MDISPKMLPKMEGFENLTELHLSKNLISNLDNLIGVIFFSRLESLYLEGNPAMKQHRQSNVGIRRVSGRNVANGILLPAPTFNLFKQFQEVYNIRICDPCYSPSKVHFDQERFVAIRPLIKGGGLMRPLRKIDTSVECEFIDEMDQNHAVPVTVRPSIDPTIIDRQLRRKFKLNDEDIKNIVHSGKIPNIKKLLKLRKVSEKQEDEEEDDNDESSNNGNELPFESQNKELQDIHYDPSKKDETFLTGVHITGGQENQKSDSDSALSWTDSENESFSDEEYFTASVMPSTIQASVRALRHALNNPVSYWRVMEDSYLKPTISSLTKNFLDSQKYNESDSPHANNSSFRRSLHSEAERTTSTSGVSNSKTPANSLWTPMNEKFLDSTKDEFLSPAEILGRKGYAPLGKMGYKLKADLQEDEYHQRSLKQAQINKLSSQSGLIKGSNKYDQLSKFAALQRARNSGRLRPNDEFDEMNDLMDFVESKVNGAEVRLSNFIFDTGKVLKSKKLSRYLPTSAVLQNNVQEEYSRIAAKYVSEAEVMIHLEPVSTRLTKMKMKGTE